MSTTCSVSGPLQREFERRADPKDKNAQALLEEMRQHVKKVGAARAERDHVAHPGHMCGPQAAGATGRGSASWEGPPARAAARSRPTFLARPVPVTPRARPAARLQLEEMRQNEDPRLSFATPEFKEAQRVFTDNFKVCQGVPQGGGRVRVERRGGRKGGRESGLQTRKGGDGRGLAGSWSHCSL